MVSSQVLTKKQSGNCSSFRMLLLESSITPGKMDHITPALKSLNWPPVFQRIDFKNVLRVYKALNGLWVACWLWSIQTPPVLWGRFTQCKGWSSIYAPHLWNKPLVFWNCGIIQIRPEKTVFYCSSLIKLFIVFFKTIFLSFTVQIYFNFSALVMFFMEAHFRHRDEESKNPVSHNYLIIMTYYLIIMT